MQRTLLILTITALALATGCATDKTARKMGADPNLQYVETETGRWLIHDMERPTPPVITPPTPSTQDQPGQKPGDAIWLFDGTSATMSNWTDTKGNPSKWVVRDGYMESVKGAGYIRTADEFGSCHLHVEFATPTPAKGSGQGRGNSGVFLPGEYEIQVLDSYENRTYADGQCGALYGRAVPEVNACRPPGQWQTYDIIYIRPIFKGETDEVIRKPWFNVWHNGVPIHYHVELDGGTGWQGPHRISDFKYHPDTGPIMLQDHGNPVRYRNIWIRPIED